MDIISLSDFYQQISTATGKELHAFSPTEQ